MVRPSTTPVCRTPSRRDSKFFCLAPNMTALVLASALPALFACAGPECGCHASPKHAPALDRRPSPKVTNRQPVSQQTSMQTPLAPVTVSVLNPDIRIMGRTQKTTLGTLNVGFPGVTLRVAIEGTDFAVRAACTSPNCIITVFVDGQSSGTVRFPQGTAEVMLARELPFGRHQLELTYQTETWLGILTLEEFKLPSGGKLVQTEPFPERKLLFIGDSVTCGEAANRDVDCPEDKAPTWDARGSYGMRLARALSAQAHLVSYGGRGLLRDWQGKRDVLNAPQFFELSLPKSTTEPTENLTWDHQAYVPDAVFISLGTNDFTLALGPFPTEKEFVETYVQFLRRIRHEYPKASIFITEGAIVNDSPKAQPKSTLVRYLKKTVSVIQDRNILYVPSVHHPGTPCNAHPTNEEHQLMAQEFEPVLRKALGW